MGDVSGRIDPLKLLNGLAHMLSEQGGLKDAGHVTETVSLMRDASKLVARATYVNVLKASSEAMLENFMTSGGWEVLNVWLQDAKIQGDDSFVIELLKVYNKMPVTVEVLKQNNCAKTIKHFSKSNNEVMKTLANEIVTEWMLKIKQKNDEHKDKVRKSSDTKVLQKQSSKSKSSKEISAGKHSSSERRPSVEKGRGSSNKHSDVADTEVSSVISDTSSNSSEQDHNKTQKSKPRTVKMFNSKSRLSGLEEEISLPKKKPDSKEKSVKRSSTPMSKSQTPPEKKPRCSSTPAAPVAKPAIEKPAPKPKPAADLNFFESTAFMDALSKDPAQQSAKRKKRLPSSADTVKTSTKETKKTATSPTQKPIVPNFYRDTLASPTEKNASNKNGKLDDNEDDEGPTKGKRKRKSVSWAKDEDLHNYFYFVMDSEERVNVNKLRDWDDAKKREMENERELLRKMKSHNDEATALQGSNVNKGSLIPWRHPPVIEGLVGLVERGGSSTERDTQKLREANVLAAIFFNRDSIPNTPAEPEPETAKDEPPKIMPLEDESGEAPEPLGTPPPYPVPKEDQPVVTSSGRISRFSPATTAVPMDMGLTTTTYSSNSTPSVSLPEGMVDFLNKITKEMKDKPSNGEGAELDSKANNELCDADATARQLNDYLNPALYRMPANLQNLVRELWAEHPQGVPASQLDKLRDMLAPFRASDGPPPLEGPFPPGMGPMAAGAWGPPPPNLGGPRNWGPPRGPPPGFNPWPGGRGPPPRGPPRKMCEYFRRGDCRNGFRCRFLHPGVNGPPV